MIWRFTTDAGTLYGTLMVTVTVDGIGGVQITESSAALDPATSETPLNRQFDGLYWFGFARIGCLIDIMSRGE